MPAILDPRGLHVPGSNRQITFLTALIVAFATGACARTTSQANGRGLERGEMSAETQACLERCELFQATADCADEEGHMLECPCDCP